MTYDPANWDPQGYDTDEDKEDVLPPGMQLETEEEGAEKVKDADDEDEEETDEDDEEDEDEKDEVKIDEDPPYGLIDEEEV